MWATCDLSFAEEGKGKGPQVLRAGTDTKGASRDTGVLLFVFCTGFRHSMDEIKVRNGYVLARSLYSRDAGGNGGGPLFRRRRLVQCVPVVCVCPLLAPAAVAVELDGA